MQKVLPEGYFFDSNRFVSPEEIVRLSYPLVTDWAMVDYQAKQFDQSRRDATESGMEIISSVVRDEDNDIAGLGEIFIDSDGAKGHLCNLMVAPHARRRGIARLILLDRLEVADKRGLHLSTVLSSGNTLHGFYEDMGFVASHRNRSYYSRPAVKK